MPVTDILSPGRWDVVSPTGAALPRVQCRSPIQGLSIYDAATLQVRRLCLGPMGRTVYFPSGTYGAEALPTPG